MKKVGKKIDIFFQFNVFIIVMKNKYLNVYLNKGVVYMYLILDRNVEKQIIDFYGKVKKNVEFFFQRCSKICVIVCINDLVIIKFLCENIVI